MRTIPLDGIRPDSLGTYLVGLGVLRTLAVDCRCESRARWSDGRFMLLTPDDFQENDLVDFLQTKWKPTKFEIWWRQTQEASKTDSLAVPRARSKETDDRVDQLDAVMVQAHRRVFNDLLGTGGNVGKRNLESVWTKCKKLCKGKEAESWLRWTLFGTGDVALPELAGGGTWFVSSNKAFNSGQTWFREGRLSPWSFLLAVAGVLLLRGAVHRRLGTHTKDKVVFPFLSRPLEPPNVRQVAHRRAEFWAPLWYRFATLGEIEWMFRQGRAEVGGRSATAPHEFAVAVLDASVDEGIPAFVRFELCQTTSGQVYEALPREHIRVAGRFDGARKYSRLLMPLLESRWIDRLPLEPRRANQRGRFIGLRGPVEAAIVRLSEDPEDQERWRALLLLFTRTQQRIDRNKRLRERCLPLPILHSSWFDRAWPQPPAELRIARAVASIGCSSSETRILTNVFGVETRGSQLYFPRVRPSRAVWVDARSVVSMRAVLRRRLIDAAETERASLKGSSPCGIGDVAAFLAGRGAIDDGLITKWIPALSLLDWSRATRETQTVEPETSLPLHPLYTLFRPLCEPDLVVGGRPLFPKNDQDSRKLFAIAVRTIVNLLLQGPIVSAIDLARRRYLGAGWKTFGTPVGEMAVDTGRLAAALLIPVSPRPLERRLLEQWIVRMNRS